MLLVWIDFFNDAFYVAPSADFRIPANNTVNDTCVLLYATSRQDDALFYTYTVTDVAVGADANIRAYHGARIDFGRRMDKHVVLMVRK